MSDKKPNPNGPIFAAMAANIGIFVVKSVAAALSGSSAMLSEAVHSLSDTANEAVLLIGKKRAKTGDKKYEFGAYRVRYLASFAVAILLFFVGGVFSAWQAVGKIEVILSGNAEIETHFALLLSALVLVACAIMEGLALRNSIKEARRHIKERELNCNLWQYWKQTKASELAVVMAEDTLALISLAFAFCGLGLTLVTNNPLFDAIGGACVGFVLIIGALILAKKIGGLLVGEALTDKEDASIVEAINTTTGVERLINMQTMALSEERVLICIKLEVHDDAHTDNSVVINQIEQKIRESLPWYSCEIYIESDHYRKDHLTQDTPLELL